MESTHCETRVSGVYHVRCGFKDIFWKIIEHDTARPWWNWCAAFWEHDDIWYIYIYNYIYIIIISIITIIIIIMFIFIIFIIIIIIIIFATGLKTCI